MFRRPIVLVGRPLLRRPRLLGAAVLGGLGYALGRARANQSGAATWPPVAPANVAQPGMALQAVSPAAATATAPDPITRLRELADLHTEGKLTDDEFAAAKRQLLGM
jgi:Short C-terminal domain